MSGSDRIPGLGAPNDVVAPAASVDVSRLGLTSDEIIVLAAVGRPSKISEVLERLWIPLDEALPYLVRLKEKGAIVVTGEGTDSGRRPNDAFADTWIKQRTPGAPNAGLSTAGPGKIPSTPAAVPTTKQGVANFEDEDPLLAAGKSSAIPSVAPMSVGTASAPSARTAGVTGAAPSPSAGSGARAVEASAQGRSAAKGSSLPDVSASRSSASASPSPPASASQPGAGRTASNAPPQQAPIASPASVSPEASAPPSAVRPSSVGATPSDEDILSAERRRAIGELDTRIATIDHFELLGIRRGATSTEVKKAYYEASRQYHPDRFFGRELGADKPKVERIFKRIAEAYGVLSDPKRRAAYEVEHPAPKVEALPPRAPRAPRPPLGLTPAGKTGETAAIKEPLFESTPMSEERITERRSRMSRHPYLAKAAKAQEMMVKARAQMAKGDLGAAMNDLLSVMQMDPRNTDAQRLLDEARRRYDAQRSKEELAKGLEAERQGDLPKAVKHFRSVIQVNDASPTALFKLAALLARGGGSIEEARLYARKAVDADPKSFDARFLLGGLLAETDGKQAKMHLDEALKIKPDHPEVTKLLKKLRWTG